MRRLALPLVVVACASSPHVGGLVPASTFPAPPPFRLPHTFEPASYRARIAFGDPKFTGTIEIDGTLSEPTTVVWLHAANLEITDAYAVRGDAKVPLDFTLVTASELLGLQARTPLAAGRWTIVVSYSGAVDQTEPPRLAPRRGPPAITPGVFRRHVNGESYYFTTSETIYARRIFPCIDEPDRKVPWQLTLDVPSELGAFSNTPIAHETALDAHHKRVTFATTLPLPSYLIAFAIGRFEVVDGGATRHGVPIRIVAARGTPIDARWAAAIGKIVAAYEDWFEIPYPYPKLDIVSVPRFGLGGMENAGLISVEELYLMATPSLGVIQHEIAHQWFGDLVTHAWWDDVWLTEKLATWLAAKIAAPYDAVTDRDPADESALALEAVVRRHPTRMPITSASHLTLQKLDSLYDYAGEILDLFEGYLGPETFRRAVQLYLKQHAHGTATSDDFAAALSEASGQQLGAAFAGYRDHDARMSFSLTLACTADHHDIAVTHGATEHGWSVPLCFAYDHDGTRDDRCMSVDPTTTTVELPSTRCPTWFMPNVGGRSLAKTWIASKDVDALVAHGWKQLTPPERRATFQQMLDEADKLAALPALVDAADDKTLRVAARALLEIYEAVPDALRQKLDAWIRKTFSAVGHDLHFVQAGDLIYIAELLGLAGDPTLATEASSLVSAHYDHSITRMAVFRVATEHDPALAEKLLTDSQKFSKPGYYEAIQALAVARTTLDVLRRQPTLLHDWKPPGIRLLLHAQCDGVHTPAHDALARELADPEIHFEDIWRDCLARKQRLAPAFAKLVGP